MVEMTKGTIIKTNEMIPNIFSDYRKNRGEQRNKEGGN